MENHGNRCFCIGKTCISEKIQCFWWAARRALENHGKPQFPGKYNVSGGRPGEHLKSMGYHTNLRFCVIKTRFSKVFGRGVPTQNVYFSIMFQGTRLGVVSTQNIDFSIGFQGVWLRGAYPEYIIFIDFSRCSGRGCRFFHDFSRYWAEGVPTQNNDFSIIFQGARLEGCLRRISIFP